MGERRSLLILCIMLFVVISSIYVFYHFSANFSDLAARTEHSYMSIGKHLYLEGVYSMGERDSGGDLIPTSFRTPVLPLLYFCLYSLVGEGPIADDVVRAILTLLHIFTIYLTYRIGRIFSYYVGCFAALIMSLDLTLLFFMNDYAFPDTIFTFFMTLFLYYFIKFVKSEKSYRNILLCALFLGVSSLTKPVSYLLVFPISIYLFVFLYIGGGWKSKKIFGVVVAFIIIQIVFVGGWKLKNYYSIGSSEFTSTTGVHLAFTIGHLISYQEGVSVTEGNKRFHRRYGNGIDDSNMTRTERALAYKHISLKLIARSPIDYAVVCLKGVRRSLLSSPPPDFLYDQKSRNEFRREVSAKYPEGLKSYVPVFRWLWSEGKFLSFIGTWLFSKAHLGFAYLLSLIGIIFMYRNRSDRWALIGMIVVAVYFIGISTPSSYARIRGPIMPVVYVLCAYAICSIVTWWSKRRGMGGANKKEFEDVWI